VVASSRVLDLIVILVVTRMLSARATKKGYPGYLSAIGVLGWTLGGAIGLLVGAWLGLELGLVATWLACAALGARASFFVIARLPDRSRLPLAAIEETFR
jgi:hypothetical protein